MISMSILPRPRNHGLADVFREGQQVRISGVTLRIAPRLRVTSKHQQGRINALIVHNRTLALHLGEQLAGEPRLTRACWTAYQSVRPS